MIFRNIASASAEGYQAGYGGREHYYHCPYAGLRKFFWVQSWQAGVMDGTNAWLKTMANE